MIPVFALFPYLSGDNFLLQLITRILIYGILVLSVEMCWGQTGIFTFGQAALFGIGGYSVGLITKNSEITDMILENKQNMPKQKININKDNLIIIKKKVSIH